MRICTTIKFKTKFSKQNCTLWENISFKFLMCCGKLFKSVKMLRQLAIHKNFNLKNQPKISKHIQFISKVKMKQWVNFLQKKTIKHSNYHWKLQKKKIFKNVYYQHSDSQTFFINLCSTLKQLCVRLKEHAKPWMYRAAAAESHHIRDFFYSYVKYFIILDLC
jgi:hypothetical protein